MLILNGTTLLCNATMPCPLPVPTNHTTLEQSRFLGVTLGMDPLSSLGLDPHNSTMHIRQYRAVVSLKDVVNMIAFLHLLKIVSEDDHSGACFCNGSPNNLKKYQNFAQDLESIHRRKMTDVIWSTLMPKYYVSDHRAKSDTYLLQYLEAHWSYFRVIGKQIVTHGWLYPDVWQACNAFQQSGTFATRIQKTVQLLQNK